MHIYVRHSTGHKNSFKSRPSSVKALPFAIIYGGSKITNFEKI